MSISPRNPFAFPAPQFEQNGKIFYQEGMDLRDWFAGQALVGLAGAVAYASGMGESCIADVTRDAYLVADVMLQERAKQ